MARHNAASRAAAKIGSAVLVCIALAWQALGAGLPATTARVGQSSPPPPTQASVPDGWQSWDEASAPDYVLEAGPAQVRKALEAGEISNSPLDGLGRPGLVAASLTHESRERARQRGRQDIEVDPVGWPDENPKVSIETPDGSTHRGRFWNRSHLLADSLGGDPARENLVTGSRMQNASGNDNEGGMAYGEQVARDWLDKHDDDDALPLCEGGGYLCAQDHRDEGGELLLIVDMFSSDGTVDMELIVYNAAKGYAIDYETGVVTRVD